MLSLFRFALVFIALTLIVAYTVMHNASTTGTMSEDAFGRLRSAGWLRLHPPRQASHDAELLRRRMLASLVELEPAQLGEHVQAIVASLNHEDSHIRALAISMLGRLEPSAVAANAAGIAAHLAHEDDQVRLAVVNVLGRAPPATIAAHAASDLVRRLADDEPAVRWAAVDTLSRLDGDALAPVVLTAVETLVAQHDVSIARAALSQWAPKLEQGGGAHKDVLSQLQHLRGIEEQQ